MRLRLSAALAASIAFALVLAAWPAEAAQKSSAGGIEASAQSRATKARRAAPVRRAAPSRVRYAPDRVAIARSRARTRVIVRRRSYLDAGTEVLPGERKFLDYVFPPGYSAFSVLGPGNTFDRQGLPSRWDVPGVRF